VTFILLTPVKRHNVNERIMNKNKKYRQTKKKNHQWSTNRALQLQIDRATPVKHKPCVTITDWQSNTSEAQTVCYNYRLTEQHQCKKINKYFYLLHLIKEWLTFIYQSDIVWNFWLTTNWSWFLWTSAVKMQISNWVYMTRCCNNPHHVRP
jgi:hypothetical protein